MRKGTIFLFVMALALAGCSADSNTPVTPQANGIIDNATIISASDLGNAGFQATGILGAYELVIHPETMAADLVSKRTSSIGEDYIVSGIAFFTIMPCPYCLAITGIALDMEGNAILTFALSHPFEPGTGTIPSAINRLDLDVFDVAMVIHPVGTSTPTSYTGTGVGIYTGYCVNPDGYTRELEEVLTETSALPYFLAIDDSSDATPPVSTFNKLAMGADTTFDVGFDMLSGVLRFDMYLTMGYGFSAVKADRLNPKYYNPEFNRKAAWKIAVTPPGGDTPAIGNTWDDSDNLSPYNVSVEIYDWQQSATVSTEPDFADADPGHVFASSEVASVTIEIPGMNPSPLPSLTIPTSGDGTPAVPLIFDVPVVNENSLPAGEYLGLVKVLDGRIPSTDWQSDERDYLIDTEDGILLDMYEMPEYATYQTFIATVMAVIIEPSPVENVTLIVNRYSGGLGYPVHGDDPWTLSWTAVTGASAYAIYYDTDPGDYSNPDAYTDNLVYVDETTSTSWTAPLEHMNIDGTHRLNGVTYVVRSRSVPGDPSSEAANSQPAMVILSGFESNSTISHMPTPTGGGEGWQYGCERGDALYYRTCCFSTYNQAHGAVTLEFDYHAGRNTEGYPGRWEFITRAAPNNLPDSTVRQLDFSERLYSGFNDVYAQWIVGTSSMQFSFPTSQADCNNFEWSSASTGSQTGVEYTAYNSTHTYHDTLFDDVNTTGNYVWSYYGDPAQNHFFGSDVNADGNPDDPYVGIARCRASYSSRPGFTLIDEVSIAIY